MQGHTIHSTALLVCLFVNIPHHAVSHHALHCIACLFGNFSLANTHTILFPVTGIQFIFPSHYETKRFAFLLFCCWRAPQIVSCPNWKTANIFVYFGVCLFVSCNSVNIAFSFGAAHSWCARQMVSSPNCSRMFLCLFVQYSVQCTVLSLPQDGFLSKLRGSRTTGVAFCVLQTLEGSLKTAFVTLKEILTASLLISCNNLDSKTTEASFQDFFSSAFEIVELCYSSIIISDEFGWKWFYHRVWNYLVVRFPCFERGSRNLIRYDQDLIETWSTVFNTMVLKSLFEDCVWLQ